jgi:hypothetical protein
MRKPTNLNGQCHEIFLFQFFLHESSAPKLLTITLGSFRNFQEFGEIFASQGAPPVSTTPAEIFHQYRWCFDTGGKFAVVSTTPVANNGNNIRLKNREFEEIKSTC